MTPPATTPTVTDAQIRAVFLANGFTIKDGQTDLKPYVYAAARALLALATPSPSYAYPCQPFAIVTDRTYSGEGPTLAVWNGENYNFSDGDCFDREFDGTLDGYEAEWLTHYQLEQRLLATLSPGKAIYQEQNPMGMWQDVTKTLYDARVAGDFRGGPVRTLYASPGKADAEDAARYRWMRANYLAADFDWQGECVLVFKWPASLVVSADCDATIDAAIQPERDKQ